MCYRELFLWKNRFLLSHVGYFGGTVATWLVHSFPDQAVKVQALAGNIVLCSWERQFTFTMLLFTLVYKWVLANLLLGVAL